MDDETGGRPVTNWRRTQSAGRDYPRRGDFSGSRSSRLTSETSWKHPKQIQQPDFGVKRQDADSTWRDRRNTKYDNNTRQNTGNVWRDTRYNKAKYIGYTALEELSESNVRDILVKINEKRDAFMNLIQSPIDRHDVFVLIVAIISKICQSTFDELKLKLLLDICKSQFMSSLKNYLSDLPYSDVKARNKLYWENQDEFWSNFITFCECITNLSPTTALKFCRALIESVSKSCLEGLCQYHEFNLREEQAAKLSETKERLIIFQKGTQTMNTPVSTESSDHQIKPPENFRELSLLPTREDLLEEKPFLRPNIIDGGYQDVEHYLDVQFRLLREDCFGPLRDGILQYIENPNKKKYDSVRIFHNVKFIKPYISQSKVGSVVQIDVAHKSNRSFKRTNWAHSKRFIFGSLVLFTKDNCNNFIVATILDRDLNLLADGKIPVSVVDESFSAELYNSNNTYTMIESEVYFEPYFHVLKALQDRTFPKHLAMQRYIVKVEPVTRPPSYLDLDTRYTLDDKDASKVRDDILEQIPDDYKLELGIEYLKEMAEDMEQHEEEEDCDKSKITKFTVLKTETWPKKEELGFNESQFQAYQLALTHEFAVIQGPPGTGKTYLGINIAKTLLRNHLLHRGCLMLVICYTNHALDQFLEAIMKFTDSIVRIGGQSRSEAMKNINISNLRSSGQHSAYRVFLEQRFFLKNVIADLQRALMHYDVLNNGVISLHCMDDIEQTMFLKQFYIRQYGGWYDDLLKLWLFENLHEYYGDFDKCLVEDLPIEDANEDIRKRTDMLLDEEGGLLDTAKVTKSDITASFSLLDAKRNLNELVKKYKNSANPHEMENLRYKILEIKAEIDLFNDMAPLRNSQPHTRIHNRTIFSRIPPAERWKLYFSWVRDKMERVRDKVVSLQGQVSTQITAFEEARMIADMEIVRSRRVVGMTTSGAARLRKLLQTVAPPIVIVEEAAEVLEQHIVTSLTQDCQHLILIGDHQQLRPSASHMKLARHYQMEVSLFERMIKNGMHSRRLGVQHRMRPEIAALISPHIYPDLENHHSVETFPDVLGMTNNLFFFTHNFYEEEINENSSRTNFREADMTLGLANYLMQQGYTSDDVTILAAYSGQMFYMKRERSRYPHLSNVKITVVDNYQGEESKIILLSLVRNNASNKIGFLGTENRICVALSRAREGFYIFGNIDILRNNSELWKKIAKTLDENKSLGSTLNLRCQNHPDEITAISTIEDYEKAPEGGCLLKCNFNLPRCNHKCLLFCHGYDREHITSITNCTVNCQKILCDLGHVCPLKCADVCQPCKQKLLKMLPCGHEMDVYCHLEPDDPTIKCLTIVETTLPHCGHKIEKACFVDVKDMQCKERCENRLEKCGHACVRTCHVTDDPHHEKYECRKSCTKPKKNCSAPLEGDLGDHQCLKLCYEDCDNCTVLVTKKRSACKHNVQIACSINPDDTPCLRKCARSLNCEHFCQKKCSEPCGDCKVMVKKIIPECNHKINDWCSNPATRKHCVSKCERTLSCGHPCKDLCKNECNIANCTEMTSEEQLSPCGHLVKLPCNIANLIKTGAEDTLSILTRLCQAKCEAELECGHQCAGTCGKCLTGRLHLPCTQPCNRLNICGHRCEEPCNQICPPCTKPCVVKCQHSKCNKICGDPCKQCQERCKRKCPHGSCTRRCGEPCDRKPCDEPCPRKLACQHRCRGLCGEPCPDICNICRPEKFPTDFLGDPFEDDDKFVLLQDCGHVMEVNNMDNLMTGDQETIQIRTCPFCRTPVVNTNRYKDSVNNTFKTEINPIKKQIFGDTKRINQKKDELEATIKKYILLYRRLLNQYKKIKTAFADLLFIMQSKTNVSLLEVDMRTVYLRILQMITDCYVKFKKYNISDLEETFNQQIDLICEILSVNKKTSTVTKISQQQQKDIRNEIKRMNAILEFSRILSNLSYKRNKDSDSVIKAREDVKSVVFSCTVYNDDKGLEVLKKLQEAANVSGMIDKMECDLVVKAIGLSAGHWFKCPSGHFYCIGECGGAMETSKCIECGAAIGGTRHTLLPSNAHAPEIDGSKFPKWSEQYNNMANFRLD